MGRKKSKSRKIRQEILHFLIFVFFVLIYYAVKLMPSAAYPPFSRLAGMLFFYTMQTSRKLILKNMDVAYGDTVSRAEKIRICREVFVSIVLDLCETIQIGKISGKRLLSESVIEGEDILRNALRQNRGVIGICPHMGNFPRLQAVMTKKGFPINCFARPPSGRHLAKFFAKLIGSVGVPLISVSDKSKAVKESIKWLSKNGVLGFYMDQHSGGGVQVDFFGKKVFSPTGAAVLAKKFNCPVIGLFTCRRQDGKQKIFIEGPYTLQKTGDTARDIQTNTAFFMQRIEHHVRQHPEQWFTWLHKRFRTP
jgi:KDO2-lipid IV(A) lauroyltransferase